MEEIDLSHTKSGDMALCVLVVKSAPIYIVSFLNSSKLHVALRGEGLLESACFGSRSLPRQLTSFCIAEYTKVFFW
jgi:hypothetical protein